MKIITLDEKKLSELAVELIKRADQAGFSPTHIVGIASGGAEVARRMMPAAPDGTRIAIVRCQRPTTKGKKLVPRALKFVPYAVSDVLRHIESSILERMGSRHGYSPRQVVDLDTGDLYEGKSEDRRILIVDDALDSGSTFEAVRLHIKKFLGSPCEIRLAALTVTTRAPKFRPDWYIYDQTILRFPWSIDYKRSRASVAV